MNLFDNMDFGLADDIHTKMEKTIIPTLNIVYRDNGHWSYDHSNISYHHLSKQYKDKDKEVTPVFKLLWSREHSINRYKIKRAKRIYIKRIMYPCRQKFAQNRKRKKGGEFDKIIKKEKTKKKPKLTSSTHPPKLLYRYVF